MSSSPLATVDEVATATAVTDTVIDDSNICKFYNPYFGNGCSNGDKCKFKHLKAKEFIGFCTRVNKEKKPSNETRNTFRSAIDLLKKGKPHKAVKKFEKIIKDCPYDELYNMWFARCHEELNQMEEAEFYYRRSISIQPKFATAHGRYAEFSWHKLNNIKQANVHFQKSLQNKENHVTHRHYAQFIEQKFGDYKKAQYHFERCLQLSPTDHGAHHSYAIVLQKMDADSNKIRYHYEESIKLYDTANVHYSYALYLKSIGQNDDAFKHFKACLKFDGYNPMYHYQFGVFLYQNMALIDDGLYHLENACSMNPNDKLYQETFNKLKATAVSTQRVYHGKQPQDEEDEDEQQSTISPLHLGHQIVSHNTFNHKSKINHNLSRISNQQNVRMCDSPHKQNGQNLQQVQPQSFLCSEFDEYLQITNSHGNQSHHTNPMEQSDSNLSPMSATPKKSKARHQCEIEFERFVVEKVVCGPAGKYYVDRFNEKQINDIRLVQFIDYAFLKSEIVMNELHIRLMLSKIEKFKKDMVVFANWLNQLRLYDEYYEVLESHGILTFDIFYYYIKETQDIIHLLGKDNLIDAMYLFDNTPKQHRQNAIGETANYTL